MAETHDNSAPATGQSRMSRASHPWEAIYRSRGRIFHEPFLGFGAVAERFAEQGCRRILDLGCGNGRHVVALRQRGFEVVGVDISQSGLRLTRDWLRDEGLQAGLVCADARRAMPLLAASFDGLFSTQVIHHARLAEVQAAIAEIWRVLRGGGMAFVSVSGRKDAEETHQEIEPGTFVPLTGPEAGLPHHIFTEAEVEREFAAFKIDDVRRLADGRVLAMWLTKPG